MCGYRTMSGGIEWADVGERMRTARVAAGLTQEELGARAGLDRTMVGRPRRFRERDLREASVFAAAELCSVTAVTDD
jgi:transcriptional regulator with XRE-family HTH domain